MSLSFTPPSLPLPQIPRFLHKQYPPPPRPLRAQMKVDHTRDLVRLSMLDSAATESNDPADDNSSCFGSLSGGAVPEEDGGDAEEYAAPRTPSGPTEPLSERVAGLGPGECVFEERERQTGT